MKTESEVSIVLAAVVIPVQLFSIAWILHKILVALQ